MKFQAIALSLGLFASMACAMSGGDLPFTNGAYNVVKVGDFTILAPPKADQREKGLKFVRVMPKDKGMIVFRAVGKPAVMTMVDVPVNLDMIFIAPDGAIQKVLTAEGTAPKTDPKTAVNYTALGALSATEAEARKADLPKTGFVVEVAAGEGARFVKTWKPEMKDKLMKPDPESRFYPNSPLYTF